MPTFRLNLAYSTEEKGTNMEREKANMGTSSQVQSFTKSPEQIALQLVLLIVQKQAPQNKQQIPPC